MIFLCYGWKLLLHFTLILTALIQVVLSFDCSRSLLLFILNCTTHTCQPLPHLIRILLNYLVLLIVIAVIIITLKIKLSECVHFTTAKLSYSGISNQLYHNTYVKKCHIRCWIATLEKTWQI